MSTVTIEFLGGEETGNVAETEWANPFTNERLILPIRQPVEIDPSANPFFAHVVAKARKNRFFRVSDIETAPIEKTRKPRKVAAVVDVEATQVTTDGDENEG